MLRVFFGVLSLLSRLFWAPGLWKALYELEPHLSHAARSFFSPAVHYSQDAEDVSLIELLPTIGFFVDVGAHHPERFSATKLLYDNGWRGINIDVTPAIIRDFPRRRPGDVNVEKVIGSGDTVTFYRFEEEALNTTDSVRAQSLTKDGLAICSEHQVITVPLQKVLENCSAPRQIDLLNVDVEGADLQVLQTLDWDCWDVGAILIEVGKPAWDLPNQPVNEFLSGKGFDPVLCFPRSVLYLERGHAAYENFR